MSITLFSDLRGSGPRDKYEIELGLYPDNTPVVDLSKTWATGGKFKAILVRPNSMQEFFTAMMIVDSIRERGGYVNSLILPCIPGQRQDRMKWEGDWLMTLKFVAKTINGMNFDKVIVLDPHSLASGMIDRLVIPEVSVGNFIRDFKNGVHYDGIIAPDAGAVKRAEIVAKDWEVPVYFATKVRDPKTNKLHGFTLDGVYAGEHYLVVDDLCDAGGTFMGLAEEIDTAGSSADLYVTHGLFSKQATEKLSKVYDTIFATDSIDAHAEHVTYFEVSEGLNIYA